MTDIGRMRGFEGRGRKSLNTGFSEDLHRSVDYQGIAGKL
jgi:hypothetical protein